MEKSDEPRTPAHPQGTAPQIQGYIYPNEIEIHWGLLIVVYPYITGVVAGAFILASLVKVFNVKEVQPLYRLSLLTALAYSSSRRSPWFPTSATRSVSTKYS